MTRLIHSAKGTSWKEHKYIKRADGIYYYPDSYEGGRHWPPGKKRKKKGSGDSETSETDRTTSLMKLTGLNKEAIDSILSRLKGVEPGSEEYQKLIGSMTGGSSEKYHQIEALLNGGGEKSNLEDWEVKMHKHIAKIVEDHPDMFKTTDDVSKNIMAAVNTDAFKNTLKAITGKDPDKMSESELASMRRKISDYYTEGYKDADSAPEPKKSSKKKKEESKEDKKEDKKEEEKKKDDKKKEDEKKKNNGASGLRPYADKLVYTGGKSGKTLAHHGILGMKWGKRNGPPYPLKNRIVRSSGSRSSETLKRARGEDVNKLSTQQLKEYNERLNAERQFADLTKGNINSGKNWVQRVVTGTATSLATAGLIALGKKAVKTIFA